MPLAGEAASFRFAGATDRHKGLPFALRPRALKNIPHFDGRFVSSISKPRRNTSAATFQDTIKGTAPAHP